MWNDRDQSMVRDLFSGRDNRSLDIGRVIWAVMAVSFIGLSCVAVWHRQPFDPMAYASGAGIILGAGGAALGFKAATEPPAPPQQPIPAILVQQPPGGTP